MWHTVQLTIDTNAYADGDLLADTQAVGAVGRRGTQTYLEEIQVIDKADQGQPLDIILLKNAVTLGTENNAPNASDANIQATFIGQVIVGSTDYKDLGGAKTAHLRDLGIELDLAPGETLSIAVISRGTGTYAADSLFLKLRLRSG